MEEVLGLLNQPGFAGLMASLTVVILLVNWAKDQLGLNGRMVLLGNLGASAIVAVLKYVGPYSMTAFDFGDWIGLTLLYAIGSAAVWSGAIKLPLHKLNGTEPAAVAAAKSVGSSTAPSGGQKGDAIAPQP